MKTFMKFVLVLAIVVGLAIAGYMTRDRWQPLVERMPSEESVESSASEKDTSSQDETIILSDQAIANLSLTAKPVQAETFWKTIQVPGMVVDRPGRSDRSVVSPVAGVIASIKHFPGETVRPGDVLLTIHILSESLHVTQTELFKATQDIKLAQATRKRLEGARGAIRPARVIEVDQQITRLRVAVKAFRRELINRGLVPSQIDAAAEGRFVNEIAVAAPSQPPDAKPLSTAPVVIPTAGGMTKRVRPTFEVQELKVDLGQPVQSGQTICLLSNHQLLSVEGRAFRDETSLLQRSVSEDWPVKIDFQETEVADWPPLEQTFRIRYIANTIDPVNRTFGFLIPLENQSKVVSNGHSTQMLWRFRPGQKVRVLVRTEKLEDVFVLPADAVAYDVAEAFVFTQNVNTFVRRPVRVLARDRLYTVVANDGSLLPGSFVVQNAAAQLERMTKSQSADDLPAGYHMHADGSLHKNEDEDK